MEHRYDVSLQTVARGLFFRAPFPRSDCAGSSSSPFERHASSARSPPSRRVDSNQVLLGLSQWVYGPYNACARQGERQATKASLLLAEQTLTGMTRSAEDNLNELLENRAVELCAIRHADMGR